MLKGNDTNAQLLGRGATCYMIGPRYRENFNLVVKNRFDVKNLLDNNLKLNFGYQKPLYSIGVSGNYHNITQSMSFGAYLKVFTYEQKWLFKHFVGVNYQFNTCHFMYNEFNISTGLNFMHQRKINFEIAYEYTQYNDEGRTHSFMPVIGVHYYFDDRRRKRYKRKKRINDNDE